MTRRRWSYHDRGKWTFGPIFVNWVRDRIASPPRITSWGIHVGRWTRNVTRRTDSIDTPGRGGIRRRYR